MESRRSIQKKPTNANELAEEIKKAISEQQTRADALKKIANQIKKQSNKS